MLPSATECFLVLSSAKLVPPRFPLEMHLVHFSSEYSSYKEAHKHPGGLVVLSVLFQIAEVSSEQLLIVMIS